MKFDPIVNPKVKADLLEWMKKEEDPYSPSEIQDIDCLYSIMQNVKDDFVIKSDKTYTVILCKKNIFLVEMPTHPMEIFSYAEINPDKFSNFIMGMILPVLKIFLVQMFDTHERKYV